MKPALLARRTILAASIDTESFVDEAFDQIVSKGNHVRKESYELLTIHLEDSQKHHNKRCVPVIEKLPTLFETVRKEEHDSFLRFVSVLADNISTEILSAWNKNMPKIVSTILRILNGRNGRGRSLFMLNVIHKLATSRVRNALIPNLKVLKEAAYQLLSNNHTLEHHQRELLTDILAALVSLEPISQYYVYINDIILEMTAVLSKLTLFPSKASGQDKPQISLFNLEKVLTPLVTGVNKVQILEGLFAQLNVLYSKILRSGHSSAFASMDFTGFIVLQRAVLTLFADINTNDPAVFIENEERISKVDLALISSRLKLSVVTTLRHILELNLPGLIRYGSLFLHPLCVLLGRREVHTVPMLLQEVLLTLQVASRVLPTSTWMVLQSTGSLQVLLQLLQVQCELISGERKHYSALDQTSSSASSSSKAQKKDAQALQLEQEGNLVFHATALVLASASVAQHQHHQMQQQQQNSVLGKRKHYVDQDVEPANDALTLLVLATVDTLLLHNGRLLVAQPEGKEFMEKLQIALLFPLLAMQRGLLPSHFQDKKMHRLFAERIRHSLALQAAVLRTAGNVFLVTGAAEHLYLPIIRDVAQVVLHQVGRGADGTLGSEAQRVLLLTGHLVHPSVLPMPSTAPTVLASEYLAKEKKRRREEATQRELDEAGAEGNGNDSAVAMSAASSSKTTASAPLFVQPSSSSASTTAAAAVPLSYAASQPAAVSQPAVKATKLSSKAPAATTAKKSAAAMKTDDDDDDDIPDIDISSDQE